MLGRPKLLARKKTTSGSGPSSPNSSVGEHSPPRMRKARTPPPEGNSRDRIAEMSEMITELKKRNEELEVLLEQERSKNKFMNPEWGCVFSQGSYTPEQSPMSANLRQPRELPGEVQPYKLSSQVLVINADLTTAPTSLSRIVKDASGRRDMRECDTPRVCCPRGSDVAYDYEEDNGANTLDLSLPDKVKRPDEEGEMIFSPPSYPMHPAMTPHSLDRIMTEHSLLALRSDKMSTRVVPPTAAAAWEYMQKAFDKENNSFDHNLSHFAALVHDLCDETKPLLQREPLYSEVKSPCYVFGDIHGNYADLAYFLESIICFKDLHYTACNLLFLGDYVDRGHYGLEVVTLLLALKLSCPDQVTLLRGNHEDPLVNADIRHYGSTSFQVQCNSLFGYERGMDVWEKVNEYVFRNLPLAADIDGRIFCVHGGVPRYAGGVDDRMKVLRSPKFPRIASFSVFEDCDPAERDWVRVACDLCWSDPKERELGRDMDEYGFSRNCRGEGTICFGAKAVDTFLDHHGFEYIFRAHQEKSDGLRLSKSGRVITIFSSSDYEGHRNGAGMLFVSRSGELRLIIKKAN